MTRRATPPTTPPAMAPMGGGEEDEVGFSVPGAGELVPEVDWPSEVAVGFDDEPEGAARHVSYKLSKPTPDEWVAHLQQRAVSRPRLTKSQMRVPPDYTTA
jgi:hypothetical protein